MSNGKFGLYGTLTFIFESDRLSSDAGQTINNMRTHLITLTRLYSTYTNKVSLKIEKKMLPKATRTDAYMSGRHGAIDHFERSSPR